MAVTEVRRGDGTADVTLNGALQLREVRFTMVFGRARFRFPEFVDRRGRIYTDIVVRSPEVYEAIHRALSSGRAADGPAGPVRFAVGDPELLRRAVRKASV